MNNSIIVTANKTGVEGFIQQTLASQIDIKNFNSNLKKLVDDWATVASNTYEKRAVSHFKKIMKVTPLAKGQTNRVATIEIPIIQNKLASFKYSTQMETVTEFGGSGKFRVTRVAIRKGVAMEVAKIPKSSKSKFFAGARDGLTPQFQGRIKGFSPKGYRGKIFIRLQAHTWKDGKRLPIAEMSGIPDAYLLTSNRVTTAVNLNERLKNLWNH